MSTPRSLSRNSRPVAVRILTYRDVSSNFGHHTTYAIEFRYADGSKHLVEKRFREFKALWDRVRGQPGFEDFDFPDKNAPLSTKTKQRRMDKFDELVKLVLVLATEKLTTWMGEGLGGDEEDGEVRKADTSSTTSSTLTAQSSQNLDGVETLGSSPPPSAAPGSLNSKTFRTGKSFSGEERSVESTAVSSKVEPLSVPKETLPPEVIPAQEDLQHLRNELSEKDKLVLRYQSANDLRVEIHDGGVERNGDDPHVEYVITVTSGFDSSLERTVRRRFREFLALRRDLQTTIPLPPKSFFFVADDGFIRNRILGLTAFLQQVVSTFSVFKVSYLRKFLDLEEVFGARAMNDPNGSMSIADKLFSRMTNEYGPTSLVSTDLVDVDIDRLLATKGNRRTLG